MTWYDMIWHDMTWYVTYSAVLQGSGSNTFINQGWQLVWSHEQHIHITHIQHNIQHNTQQVKYTTYTSYRDHVYLQGWGSNAFIDHICAVTHFSITLVFISRRCVDHDWRSVGIEVSHKYSSTLLHAHKQCMRIVATACRYSSSAFTDCVLSDFINYSQSAKSELWQIGVLKQIRTLEGWFQFPPHRTDRL